MSILRCRRHSDVARQLRMRSLTYKLIIENGSGFRGFAGLKVRLHLIQTVYAWWKWYAMSNSACYSHNMITFIVI